MNSNSLVNLSLLLILYEVLIYGSVFISGHRLQSARRWISEVSQGSATNRSNIIVDEYYEVVIIGAGWAGISAANTLFKKNMINFTVLEARPYIGGRSVTSFAFGKDTPVDLGSSWIHGVNGNPIRDLAENYGVEYSTISNSLAVYLSNSTHLSDDAVNQLYESFWGGSDGFMPYQERKQSSTKIDQSMAKTAAGYASFKQMNALQRREFDWLADTFIVQEYAADLYQLSTWWWDSDYELDGGDAFLGVVGGGYSTVIQKYATEILPFIQRNATVTNVDYSSGPVLVNYNNMGELKTVSASKIIVTLPLGVLKAGSVTFTPSFSDAASTEKGRAKQRAINRLGMGVMNKCALFWNNMTDEEVFWPKDREWIEEIADAGKQSGWTEWYNPYRMNGKKPLLIGFVAGDFAVQIENLTDAEITQQAVASLRRIFHDTNDTVPDPSASLVTRWNSDKFAMGSYSYQKVGSTEPSRKYLAAPLDGKVFFAGEATHSRYPSTTHGAFLSGKKVAYKILKLLNNGK